MAWFPVRTLQLHVRRPCEYFYSPEVTNPTIFRQEQSGLPYNGTSCAADGRAGKGLPEAIMARKPPFDAATQAKCIVERVRSRQPDTQPN